MFGFIVKAFTLFYTAFYYGALLVEGSNAEVLQEKGNHSEVY